MYSSETKLSCIKTELKRCTMTESLWNKYDLSCNDYYYNYYNNNYYYILKTCKTAVTTSSPTIVAVPPGSWLNSIVGNLMYSAIKRTAWRAF